MPPITYDFFVSYAESGQTNGANAIKKQLHEFVNAVAGHVAARTPPSSSHKTHFFDDSVSNVDGKKAIVDALQNSQVLLAFWTRPYFASINCGKEFQFFLDREVQSINSDAGAAFRPTRIIPIFLDDEDRVIEYLPFDNGLKTHLLTLSRRITCSITPITERPNYPANGLNTLYLRKMRDFEIMAKIIADRIDDIINENKSNTFPQLPSLISYDKLPSSFPAPVESSPTNLAGPTRARVFYMVATREEMKSSQEAHEYGERPCQWKPFVNDSNLEINSATHNGISRVNIYDQNHSVFPAQLLNEIGNSEQHNIPVLLVVDLQTLHVLGSNQLRQLQGYDNRRMFHVGLVALGRKGSNSGTNETDYQEELMMYNLMKSITSSRERDNYIEIVSTIMRNIVLNIHRSGQPTQPFSSSTPPRLNGSGVRQ